MTAPKIAATAPKIAATAATSPPANTTSGRPGDGAARDVGEDVVTRYGSRHGST